MQLRRWRSSRTQLCSSFYKVSWLFPYQNGGDSLMMEMLPLPHIASMLHFANCSEVTIPLMGFLSCTGCVASIWHEYALGWTLDGIGSAINVCLGDCSFSAYMISDKVLHYERCGPRWYWEGSSWGGVQCFHYVTQELLYHRATETSCLT